MNEVNEDYDFEWLGRIDVINSADTYIASRIVDE